jgi:hypothetical protein
MYFGGTVGGKEFAVDASLIAADANKQRSIQARSGSRSAILRPQAEL